MKIILRVSGLTALNFFVLTNSEYIDIFQLVYDFSKLPLFRTFSIQLIYVSISLTISFLALVLIEFFKPFIEIYLMFYLKISFYFFINFKGDIMELRAKCLTTTSSLGGFFITSSSVTCTLLFK